MDYEIINKKIREQQQDYKQNFGLIIASSFSMIILLLTFVKERTFILDLGISSLFVSVIVECHLYLYSNEINISIFSLIFAILE